MPKMNDMFPSKWLKAEDCEDADLILTIRDIKTETVGQGADSAEKWVLYFDEVDKGLVLNKTNTKAIAKIHGDDTDEWEGKRVALYATEVEFQGDTMLGIRIRLKEPKKGKKGGQPASASAAAEAEDADIPF